MANLVKVVERRDPQRARRPRGANGFARRTSDKIVPSPEAEVAKADQTASMPMALMPAPIAGPELHVEDSDPQDTLVKLRELVVGPTQRLNEARLEELMAIFEERDASLRAAFEELNERHSQHELTVKREAIEMATALREELDAMANTLVREISTSVTSINDALAQANAEMGAFHKETMAWMKSNGDAQDQKLEAAQAFNKTQRDEIQAHFQGELIALKNNLMNTIANCQRESQVQMGRTLMALSEDMGRAASAHL